MAIFTDSWNRMVCDAWLTHEEAIGAATKAGYEQDPEIPNRSVVTDGEYRYTLHFKSLTLMPGMTGLVWFWNSENEDNL